MVALPPTGRRAIPAARLFRSTVGGDQAADDTTQALAHRRRGVGPPAVLVPVVPDQVGVLRLHPPEVVVLERSAQVQVLPGDEPGPGLRRPPHNLLDLGRPVGEPGQDGGHQHAGGNASVVETPHRVQALAGMGGSRFRAGPHVGIEGADREVNGHFGHLGRLGEQVEVPQHQWGLGQDRERVTSLDQDLDDPPCQLVLALGRLVGVGVGPHGDRVPGPPTGSRLVAYHLRRVDLHHDLGVEVLADVQAEVVVAGPGEAVGAGVAASPVGVDGVAEGKHPRVRDPVDDGVRLHMEELEAPVGPPSHLALDDRVEQRRTVTRRIGRDPAELSHVATA